MSRADSTVRIEPPKGWKLVDLAEISAYRDLFYFLVWRDIKALYAQTVLGFSWAVLKPLIQIGIFTIIFGKVAKLPTDGIPYALFSTVAIVPWTYMSDAMSNASQSLVTQSQVLGKVYFPRVIFPMTPILAKLVDFSIACLLIVAAMIFFQVPLTWNIVWFPFFVILMMAVPLGISLWMSALAIRYRDIKFAMPFVMRMLIYSAPILYTASSIPDKWRFLYSLNPLVAVIEGFRACLLGLPLEWQWIWPGVLSAVILVFGGLLYFRRMERVFVDVI